MVYVTTTYPHEHNLRAMDAYASPSIKNPGVMIATGYGALPLSSSSAAFEVNVEKGDPPARPSGNNASGNTSGAWPASLTSSGGVQGKGGVSPGCDQIV